MLESVRPINALECLHQFPRPPQRRHSRLLHNPDSLLCQCYVNWYISYFSDGDSSKFLLISAFRSIFEIICGRRWGVWRREYSRVCYNLFYSVSKFNWCHSVSRGLDGDWVSCSCLMFIQLEGFLLFIIAIWARQLPQLSKPLVRKSRRDRHQILLWIP